jgi:hypothetical protein
MKATSPLCAPTAAAQARGGLREHSTNQAAGQQGSQQGVVVEHIAHGLPFGGWRRAVLELRIHLRKQLITSLIASTRLLIEPLPGSPGADSLVQQALHGRGCGGWLLHHTHARHSITKASFTNAGPARERLGSRLDFYHDPIQIRVASA